MSDHQHCGHEHGHDEQSHDHDEEDVGPQNNLFKYIDRTNVVALNTGRGRGPEVIKAWHERNNDDVFLRSDDDNEMIIRVPFTGSVRLHRLLLKTGATEHSRMTVSLYANQDNLDFQDAETKPPSQKFNIAPGISSIGEYSVMRTKFSNLSTIALYLRAEENSDPIQIFFVGFLGHWNELKREPVVTVYEAQANLADHEKIQGLDGTHSSLK